MPVELPLQLGLDQGNSGGAAGGGGRQAEHRAARPTQVPVGRIDNEIGVGRIVNGRDLTMTDPQRFVDDLDDWGQAVGGTGRCRDDSVPARVVLMMINTQDDIEHVARFDRCGHNDPLRAAIEMTLNGFGGQELAGAFEDEVNAEVAPGNLGGRRMRGKPQGSVINTDGAVIDRSNISAPAALYAVESEQVSGRCRAPFEFIEVHNLESVAGTRIIVRSLGGAEGTPQRKSADTTHPVDTNSHGDLSAFMQRAETPVVSTIVESWDNSVTYR